MALIHFIKNILIVLLRTLINIDLKWLKQIKFQCTSENTQIANINVIQVDK